MTDWLSRRLARVDKLKIVTETMFTPQAAHTASIAGQAQPTSMFFTARSLPDLCTAKFIDGSAVAAFKRALESPGRFSMILRFA
jgi:hypothetical protein